MRIPTSALIFMACITFIGIIVVSDYESTELEYGASATPIDDLSAFLADDQTSEGVYDWDNYHCVHFSVTLVDNLTAAGYNAAPVILSTYRPGLWSHMVVSVNLGNDTVYIEPQTDEIFPPTRWDHNVSLGDEVVRVNISTARTMMI